MNTQIQFMMIGGFLGAGKTTALARLARHYLAQDRRVGLVTNDQAVDLVDTHALRAQGFLVGEVPGACFCCHFDSLITTLASLEEEQTPDVIIAEPVGSCTDLMATVMQPLRKMHGDCYVVAPLVVLLKPEHGQKILRQQRKSGFSPKAAYIFLKQIEEADIVAINKTDRLTQAERDELVQLVRDRFPDKQVLAVSARDGDGFDELITCMERTATAPARFMEVDYNIYAEGEAELGWLNCHIVVSPTDRSFSLDCLVRDIVELLGRQLSEKGVEAAHVKVLGQCDDSVSVANLVATGADAELSRASAVSVPHAQLILNARVATAPEELESVVRRVLQQVGRAHDRDLTIDRLRCFRPGRPVPTHRLENPLS